MSHSQRLPSYQILVCLAVSWLLNYSGWLKAKDHNWDSSSKLEISSFALDTLNYHFGPETSAQIYLPLHVHRRPLILDLSLLAFYVDREPTWAPASWQCNASGQINSKFGVRELQMNLLNYVHRHHALNVKKCTHVVGYGYVRSRLRSSQHSITRYFLTVRSKKYYTRNQSFNNHSIYDLICNLFYGHRQISHFGDSCLFYSYLMLSMLFQTTSAKFDRFFQHSSHRNSKTSFS